jgi:hypothetical protein
MRHLRKIVFLCSWAAVVLLLPAASAFSQELIGKVIDENGQLVVGAKVSLSGAVPGSSLSAVSDDAGRFVIPAVPPGIYDLRAEKPGYYATVSRGLNVAQRAAPLEVVLNHMHEYEERVSVTYSSPVIDRQKASGASTLTADEITSLPYTSTRDFRNALALNPGAVKDKSGGMHISGGGENQVSYSLDGFNIAGPVSGALDSWIPVDSIRAVRVETSRSSAEFGRGSAGVMAIESSQGDDHFRFSSSSFFPSIAIRNGFELSSWSPRATISGPIAKGRAWFYSALDLQYSQNRIRELPPGDNSNHSWMDSDLTRIQVNLTNRNILSGGFLFNFRQSRHDGIGPLDPVETSRNLSDRLSFFNLKDQAFIGGWVLEAGVALNQSNNRALPLGEQLYVISPEGQSGNFYLQSQRRATRMQYLASVLPPIQNWHGRHILKYGIDADSIRYRQFAERRPFAAVDNNGDLTRQVEFQGGPIFGRNTSEFSGFLEDSWKINEETFVEAGVRFDWDQILRQPLWSPRLAITWGPARFPDSKFSAGFGVFYDATDLNLLTRSLDQQRTDIFYAQQGVPAQGEPILTRFAANERELRAPYYRNWSLGWQQKIPRGFYVETNFVRRMGREGWAYNLLPSAEDLPWQHVYQLGSTRRDSYTYLDVALSHTFGGKYPWLLSYARSRARSSEIIDFSLDNPIFARQAAGPLNWDSPNRLISWSVFPVPHLKNYSWAYFAEWHSGVPWSQVDQFQQLVGFPNSRRLPEYFSLNLQAERRIHLFHAYWGLRAGFNDLTGHKNPTVVNNNVDSMDFGRFSGSRGRTFVARIRLLGKK